MQTILALRTQLTLAKLSDGGRPIKHWSYQARTTSRAC